MQVSDLKAFIESMVPILTTAGASQKLLGEFGGLSSSLAAFQEMELSQFSALIQQAEEYRRTGIFSVAPVKAKSNRAAPKSVGYSADEALRDVNHLIENITTPEMSYAVIADAIRKLDVLKKPDIDKVCVDLKLGKPKTKKDGIQAVKDKVESLKATFDRTDF